jgi:hypothetical protein
MGGSKLFFEVSSGDLIEGAGGYAGQGYAQFLGLVQYFLVPQAELL